MNAEAIADEAWYQDAGWQAAEAEADADIRAGRVRTFDNMDDMFAEFDGVRGDPDGDALAHR